MELSREMEITFTMPLHGLPDNGLLEKPYLRGSCDAIKFWTGLVFSDMPRTPRTQASA